MTANPEAQRYKAYGAALEAIQERYGGLCAPRSTVIQLGTTVSEVFPNDSERVSLTFINLGGNVVYFAPDPNVSSTRGILLGPNGGSITMNERDDSLLPTLQWFALAAGVANDCYCLAIRRDVATRP